MYRILLFKTKIKAYIHSLRKLYYMANEHRLKNNCSDYTGYLFCKGQCLFSTIPTVKMKYLIYDIKVSSIIRLLVFANMQMVLN